MVYFLALHGNFGSPPDWEGVFDVLRARYSQAVFDAPSLWASAPEATIDELSKRIADAQRRNYPVVLLGYSLGARLALELVATKNLVLDGLVLCSVNPGLTEESARAERRKSDERWVKKILDENLPWWKIIAEWNSQTIFNRSKESPPFRFTSSEEERIVRRGVANGFQAWSLGQLASRWSVLKGITFPVLCVAGEYDEKFRRIAEEIQALSNEKVASEVLSAAGHRIHLDAPDQLGQRIVQFVTGLSKLSRGEK